MHNMQYIKIFEQFIGKDVTQVELEDFVNKFDLIDKDEYDKTLKNNINDIIKLFKKEKSVADIVSKYNNLRQIMSDADDFYAKEVLRLSLPQGDLQSSNPQIPTIDIK